MNKTEFINELTRLKQITDEDKFDKEVDKLNERLESLQFEDRSNHELKYFESLLHKFSIMAKTSSSRIEKELNSHKKLLTELKNTKHDLTVKAREVDEELKKTTGNISTVEENIKIYEDLKLLAE